MNMELFDRHEAEQAKMEAKAPVCERCHKPIMDPYLYDMWGEVYCEACMDRHRKRTEDYM